MLVTRSFVSTLFVTIVGLGASVAHGQNFPNKPIRMLANEPGGGNDFTARLIAQGISASLGQPVIVENRPALIATETAVKAQPDGYTLLTTGNSTWLLQFLRDNVPWDPVRDFSPITVVTRAPLILVVHPSLPESVKELIALARAKPGALNYAGMSGGSIPTLAAELFKAMASVNIVAINYKGSAPAVTAVMAGESHMIIISPLSVMPNVKSGKLRALAVTSAQPSALAPGLPTLAASGVPGYEATGMTSILAPAKTPLALVNQLNQEIVRVLNKAEVKEKYFNAGAEVVGNSPAELATTIKSDIAKWGKVIKDAGLKAD